MMEEMKKASYQSPKKKGTEGENKTKVVKKK